MKKMLKIILEVFEKENIFFEPDILRKEKDNFFIIVDGVTLRIQTFNDIIDTKEKKVLHLYHENNNWIGGSLFSKIKYEENNIHNFKIELRKNIKQIKLSNIYGGNTEIWFEELKRDKNIRIESFDDIKLKDELNAILKVSTIHEREIKLFDATIKGIEGGFLLLINREEVGEINFKDIV
jgi:hypothetical protein